MPRRKPRAQKRKCGMGPRSAPWRSLARVPRPPGAIEDPRSLLPKEPRTAAASLGARGPPQRGPPLASHAADPASAPWWSTASQVTLARGALLLPSWPPPQTSVCSHRLFPGLVT